MIVIYADYMPSSTQAAALNLKRANRLLKLNWNSKKYILRFSLYALCEMMLNHEFYKL